MTHDELQELLGAYALDAVEPHEAAAVEDHLRSCPRCRAEVADHRETAAYLAHAGAEAPPALWDRIAGAIDAPAGAVPLAPRFAGRGSQRRWATALVAVAGAAAAAVIVVLGVQVRDQERRMDEMEAALAVADRGLAAAMADPAAVMMGLVGDGGTHVPVVISGRTAWLQAGTLPALAPGRTYQLWGLAGEDLVSVAVLGHDPGVVSFDVAGYSLLAITEEVAPGVVRSENEPVAAGRLA